MYESWLNENLMWKKSFKTKLNTLHYFCTYMVWKMANNFIFLPFEYIVNSSMEISFIKAEQIILYFLSEHKLSFNKRKDYMASDNCNLNKDNGNSLFIS